MTLKYAKCNKYLFQTVPVIRDRVGGHEQENIRFYLRILTRNQNVAYFVLENSLHF